MGFVLFFLITGFHNVTSEMSTKQKSSCSSSIIPGLCDFMCLCMGGLLPRCVFPCSISQGQVAVFHVLLLVELLLFIEVCKAHLAASSFLSVSNVLSLSLLFCLCPSSSVNHPVQPNRGFSPIRPESEPMNVTAVPRK